jgi:hypothetical protein
LHDGIDHGVKILARCSACSLHRHALAHGGDITRQPGDVDVSRQVTFFDGAFKPMP